jgi:hypothetical protein
VLIIPSSWGSQLDGEIISTPCRISPKDPYPLPRIDQIVDSTTGCDLLCFLDSFSGYHQIKMAREDEEKTAFITPCGVYCYVCISFGL